jgi:deoxyribodipyrimidine photo-lyase
VSTQRSDLNVIWFKRDLRIADHEPLHAALHKGGPVLGLYVIEPSVVGAEDYAPRHWQCIAEALADLKIALADVGVPLIVAKSEVVAGLEELRNQADREGRNLQIWSHQETGNALTFQRDRAVASWAKSAGVVWNEYLQHGVFRALAKRDGWAQRWEELMHRPIAALAAVQSGERKAVADRMKLDGAIRAIPSAAELGLSGEPCPHRQSARRQDALATLHSFLDHRGANYQTQMSSPVTAATACSRLSVPLAYGTISMREIVQATEARVEDLREARRCKKPGDYKLGSLRAFLARLHWHCHFIQKLESEPAVEFRAFIPEMDELRTDGETALPAAERARRLQAWTDGATGYPFVDACMRSLRETGWINFRMRAMLMSFASYDLWLPWRDSGMVLARRFTDYEPGIHWPQVQMQSGTTGINTLRMYSPVKQSQDQDSAGLFIRKWVPELMEVSGDFIHEPWLMPASVQSAVGCVIGKDYAPPIVDHQEAVRTARAHFAALRQRYNLRAKAKKVFARHGSRKRPGTQIVDPRWFETKAQPSPQLELEGLD